MKKLWMMPVFLILLTSVVFAEPPAGTETILVKANGLVCDFCARGLEKKFKTREEVDKVSVDLTTKFVTVVLKKDKTLTDEEVRKLVTDSGYTVSSLNIERKQA